VTFLLNVSQRLPDAGDLDECWIAATYTCARYYDRKCVLPTVTDFRAAAANPDEPGPTGGTTSDIMEGCLRYFPGFGPRQFVSTDWTLFEQYLDDGWVASLGVRSSELPSYLRYGFLGEHQVAVQKAPGFRMCNPLAANGTASQVVSGDAVKAAARAFVNAGRIQAVLFPRGDVAMLYTKAASPGRFTIRAGASPRAYALGAGGLVVVKQWQARDVDSAAPFDHVLTRVGGDIDPNLNVMLHGTAGFFSGLYVSARAVVESFDPDATPYSQADLDSAKSAARSSALAEVRTAISHIL
jgi:hypothetical protein